LEAFAIPDTIDRFLDLGHRVTGFAFQNGRGTMGRLDLERHLHSPTRAAHDSIARVIGFANAKGMSLGRLVEFGQEAGEHPGHVNSMVGDRQDPVPYGVVLAP
jgi:hypothetical protein